MGHNIHHGRDDVWHIMGCLIVPHPIKAVFDAAFAGAVNRLLYNSWI